jgi:hypothetical protein
MAFLLPPSGAVVSWAIEVKAHSMAVQASIDLLIVYSFSISKLLNRYRNENGFYTIPEKRMDERQ